MKTNDNNSYNFKVNLSGIIDVLSNHLYSEPKVFIRELLQNSTDAITARQQFQPDFEPQIHVEVVAGADQQPAQLVFTDNGIGLSKEDIHQFVARIGASSKRSTEELSKQRSDFIGQFGIGLLSCFMVTDEIVILTQSAKGGPAIEWHGHSDGSYTLKELENPLQIGTRIYLQQKPDSTLFFDNKKITQLLQYYGGQLPFPIYWATNTEALNAEQGILFAPHATESERLEVGKNLFDTDYLAAIPLNTADGHIQGVAYVLPFTPNPSRKTTHKVYLRKMLISEQIENILPDWAFFVKCIINTNHLRPTASREAFYEDEQLQATREQLGKLIKRFLVRMAEMDIRRFNRFLRIHHLALKMLAIHDAEFFEFITPYLFFETAIGTLKLTEITKKHPKLLFTTNHNEYQQLSSIASTQGVPVINAGYLYDKELLSKYAKQYDYPIRLVNTDYFIDQFEALSVEEREASFDFLRQAQKALASFNCQPVLRKFHPANIPTIYYMDQEMNFLRSIQKSQEQATNVWAEILETVVDSSTTNTHSKLCLNYRHPLIQQLAKERSNNQLAIEMLYVQALMLGRHPLQQRELNILSDGLIQLISTSKPNE